MISSILLTTSTSAAEFSSLVGLSAGFVGVVSAVYLQLLAKNHCPPIYIALFFFVGSGMILANFASVNVAVGVWADWLPVIGNLLILVVEVAALRWVVNHTAVEHPGPTPRVDDGNI